MHGANRLGGNGVANSTVFGGIAGDTIAAWLAARARVARARRRSARVGARARRGAVFGLRADPGALESMRERLYGLMWDDAGIVRDRASLARAATALDALDAELGAIGIADGARAFNLTWHDALNLANLIAVSRVIVAAATARENSRGAHYRSDFPDEGELATSTFVRVRQRDGKLATEAVPVRFTRVAPGGAISASSELAAGGDAVDDDLPVDALDPEGVRIQRKAGQKRRSAGEPDTSRR